MKKVMFLIFFISTFLLYGCATQELPKTIEPVVETIPEPVEETQPEEVKPVEEVKEEPKIETPAEKELFEPSLTYPGVYNGPLYATSEQIGNYPNKEEYIGNLEKNGVNFLVGMFTIFGGTTDETFVSHSNLGYVVDFTSRYSGGVVPYFGSGIGGEELDSLVKTQGNVWVSMYSDVLNSYEPFVGEEFIQGLGEIETQEWSVRHNDPTILKAIDLAQANNKDIMFHPVASKLDDVKDLIEKYPETTFLIHMYREDVKNGQQKLIDLLKNHDNLYFSIDAAHIAYYDGNDILYSYYDQYGDEAKIQFVSTVNNNYDSILNSAVSAYKPIVKAAPYKVVWGTEAGPDYSFDPEVYNLLIKISRDFIAKVTEYTVQQEALAYKNALEAFGPGVKPSKETNVINTDSWPLCELSEIDKTCEYCGVVGEDEDVPPEAELCENQCILKMKCKDPLDNE